MQREKPGAQRKQISIQSGAIPTPLSWRLFTAKRLRLRPAECAKSHLFIAIIRNSGGSRRCRLIEPAFNPFGRINQWARAKNAGHFGVNRELGAGSWD